MAGCSVVVLTPLRIAGAAALISGLAAVLLYGYIFESLFCACQCRDRWDQHPAIGWIPLWNQYLMSKAAGMTTLGIALLLDQLAVTVLACMALNGSEPALGWCVIYVAMGMFIKSLISCQLYQRACPEAWRKYNWASILTLGLLRPVFLYLLRKRLI